MKLLIITRKIDRQNGPAGFIYHWISEFAKQCDELNVICLEQGDITGLPKNCHVYSLGKERGKNQWREFWRLQRLARLLVPQADGVFSHQNPEYGILIAP